MTSRRVVDDVHRLVRPARAGHAGTLDPLASGVLIVAVGTATRLIEYVQRMPKQYRGTFLLGRSSTTEDVEGEITELENPPIPPRDEVEAAAAKFIGRIEQRPPAFSALRIDGKRAYDLARKGKEVALKPRPVEIYDLKVVEYDYPTLSLDIRCGSGTYVRSLGRDLAESLGTAAVMSALIRTSIGPFEIADAADAEQLTGDNLGECLHPMFSAVKTVLPCIELTDDELIRVGHGQTISPTATCPAKEIAAIDSAGRLRAILTEREPDWFKPARVFPLE